MAQPLTPDLGQRDFHAALIADHPAVLHALVLAAQTLPVGHGAKDAGAKQPVTLRLKGAIVDGFRLGHFPMRPGTDFLRRRELDPDRVEVGDRAGKFEWAGTVQGGSSWRSKALSVPGLWFSGRRSPPGALAHGTTAFSLQICAYGPVQGHTISRQPPVAVPARAASTRRGPTASSARRPSKALEARG